MAETELSIVLKLLDQASDKLKKVTSDLKGQTAGITEENKKLQTQSDKAHKSIREQFRQSSKEVRMFRREMFFVIAAVAAIIAVVKQASEYNEEARRSFNNFTTATKTFATVLGSNLTPAVDFFTIVIKGLQIALTAVVAGFIKAFSFIAEFFTNLKKGPIEAYKRAIAVANAATDDFIKKVEDTKIVVNLFEAIKQRIEAYNQALEKQKLLFIDGRISAEEYYGYLTSAGVADMQIKQMQLAVMEEVARLENQLQNETTIAWMKAIYTKKQLLEEFRRRVLLNWQDILKGISSALGQLQSALSAAEEFGRGFARAAAAVSMAMAIMNVAEGITRAYKDYPWPFSMVVSGIIAAAGAIQIATIAAQKFHEGGFLKAHSGLAVDEVPIIAQTGEGILSRRGMAALGGEAVLNRLNAGGGRGDILININVDNPVISKESDIDYLVEVVSQRLAREVERIR